MFRTLIDLMAPAPGEAILDVGCGAGSLDRLLARRLGSANAITAIDTNPFLLSEAAALARRRASTDAFALRPATPRRCRSPTNRSTASFRSRCSRSATPTARWPRWCAWQGPEVGSGVIVRSIDLPQWWSVAVPDPIRHKTATPPQSVGAKGIADASLYRRAQAAGLEDLTCFPSLVTLDRPDGPIWRYREDHLLSQLTAEETAAWRAARDAAAKRRPPFHGSSHALRRGAQALAALRSKI